MRFATLILIALLSLAVTTPGHADTGYEINAILPLTGGGAFVGNDARNALLMIEQSVNKSGGIRGQSLHFNIVDDKTDPQVALELAQQLIAKKAPVFLGPILGAECNAIFPVVQSAGPVMYCLSPVLQPPAGSFGFVASSSIYDYIVATVRYLRERGWKRVALITSIDATGQDGERSFDRAVADPENRNAIVIVDKEHFNNTDLSVAAQMSHIKAGSPDAVILWTTGTPFGTLLHGAYDVGLNAALVTSVSNLNYTQLASYASFMPDNLYMVAPPYAAAGEMPSGPVRTNVLSFLDAMRTAGLRPTQGEVIAWDAAQLVIEAVRKIGLDANAAQIKGYLAGVRGWSGINGTYDFRQIPQRGIGNNWLFMVRYDKAKQTVAAVSKPGGEPLRP